MKKTLATAVALTAGVVAPTCHAAEPLPTDSSRIIDVEEAIVVAAPKETQKLRQQAVSATVIGPTVMQDFDLRSVRSLSAMVPGVFAPDYGSRLSSAIYMRGIGSRTNSPAVGLYVDNLPYIDKTAYDFRFADVERIDVLRGPQGTIYGRNSMAGLIRIFTRNPLRHTGTSLHLGANTRNAGRRAQLNTAFRPAQNVGLAVSGFYEGDNGFFRNAQGRAADGAETGGGRLRAVWRANSRLRLDATAGYEHLDQDADPYYYDGPADGAAADPYAAQRGHINQTRRPYYRRSLMNSGVSVQWQAPRFLFTANTSYQYLCDRLNIDQDFLQDDIFKLDQRQRQHNLTEELTLRSPLGRRWLWTTGLFAAFQQLHTTCPVTFGPEGIEYLNSQIASGLSGAGMPMSLALTGSSLPFTSRFSTPSANAALFHQSTVRHLGLHGLSATVGLRLDYDHQQLNLDAATASAVAYRFMMPSFGVDAQRAVSPSMLDRLSDDYWQVLPKFALQYDLPRQLGNAYVSISKGYRSGGYNIQQYSDLAQALLRRQLMGDVGQVSAQTIDGLPLSQAVKERAKAAMQQALDRHTPAPPRAASLRFRPEKSWNYEVGAHLNLAGGALRLDVAAFLTRTRDQQIARFATSGLGRMTVNAGRSASRGFEASVAWSALDNRLSLMANYGFTRATFKRYDAGTSVSAAGDTLRLDYRGHRVPFAPTHTVGAGLDFTQPLRHRLVHSLTAGLTLTGCGDLYWDEANALHQGFYALLGLHAGLTVGPAELRLWAKNLTATRYNTFRFESMGRLFSQHGQPRHMGIDLTVRF